VVRCGVIGGGQHLSRDSRQCTREYALDSHSIVLPLSLHAA
jgi:hypothetical protein